MDACQFNNELFKSSCPVKKKSTSQMRREEARRNIYCPNKYKQVSVEESEDKKCTDKAKASEVIEEVFGKSEKSKNLL